MYSVKKLIRLCNNPCCIFNKPDDDKMCVKEM